jgi:succinate dehydrogenase / fumarate reductase cytochrome b subunit
MTELAKKAARVPQHQPPGPPDLSLAPAGIVSILHRVSGLLMFLLLPFIIWMFDNSLSSEFSFEIFSGLQRRHRLRAGLVHQAGHAGHDLGLSAPLHRGVRHLWMDVTHSA